MYACIHIYIYIYIIPPSPGREVPRQEAGGGGARVPGGLVEWLAKAAAEWLRSSCPAVAKPLLSYMLAYAERWRAILRSVGVFLSWRWIWTFKFIRFAPGRQDHGLVQFMQFLMQSLMKDPVGARMQASAPLVGHAASFICGIGAPNPHLSIRAICA